MILHKRAPDGVFGPHPCVSRRGFRSAPGSQPSWSGSHRDAHTALSGPLGAPGSDLSSRLSAAGRAPRVSRSLAATGRRAGRTGSAPRRDSAPPPPCSSSREELPPPPTCSRASGGEQLPHGSGASEPRHAPRQPRLSGVRGHRAAAARAPGRARSQDSAKFRGSAGRRREGSARAARHLLVAGSSAARKMSR